MNPTDHVERAIREFQVTTSAETDRRVLEDAYTALEKSAQPKPTKEGLRPRRVTILIRLAELAAIAALILITFHWLAGKPTGQPVSLAQIHEAVQNVGNVCVSRFQPGRTEPLLQVWTSQTLKMQLFQSERPGGTEFVLCDVGNMTKKTKYPWSSSISTTALSTEALAEAKESISRHLAMFPFSDLRDAPPRAEWNRVEDRQVAAIVPGSQVYELTWSQEDADPSSMAGSRKWRVFIDARTNLPSRTEYYVKKPSDNEYAFESSAVVTYPTENDIAFLAKQIFGPAGEPGYIGTPEHQPVDPVRKE